MNRNERRTAGRGIFALLCAAFLFATLFAGCKSPAAPGGQDDGKLRVVTTIFPLYDWAREVIGPREDVELTCLLENGADYHSYQPSASDIVKVSTADVFFYVGGGSEGWAEDALRNVTNERQKRIRLFTVLEDRLREEETVEGMEEEHADEHGSDDEYDEHLFLSLVNAEKSVEALRDALQEADPAHEADYEKNASAYLARLSALDDAFRETVRTAGRDTILFGDRFPFLYLTKDYGIRYYAAFQGCSSDTEASFSTVAFLGEKVKEYELPAVIMLEKSDRKLAEAVVSASGRADVLILTMDSMQAVTPEERASGANYLGIMEKNLETLRKAMN